MPVRKSLKRRSRKFSSKRLSKRLRTMKRNSKRMSRKSMKRGGGGEHCGHERKSKRSMSGGYYNNTSIGFRKGSFLIR